MAGKKYFDMNLKKVTDDRNQEIFELAKIIHKAEFPNSSCWDNCHQCIYESNCEYIKAAKMIIEAGWHR